MQSILVVSSLLAVVHAAAPPLVNGKDSLQDFHSIKNINPAITIDPAAAFPTPQEQQQIQEQDQQQKKETVGVIDNRFSHVDAHGGKEGHGQVKTRDLHGFIEQPQINSVVQDATYRFPLIRYLQYGWTYPYGNYYPYNIVGRV